MKKFAAMLLVLLLCWGMACAEEAAFTFRNGLYWGMTPEEVLAAEGRSAFDVEYINRSQGTSQCLLQNVSVGSFQAEIVFNFLEERLISAAIVPEATDAATLEQMMYLVYGQPDTGAIMRENVTAAWQIAPNAYVCVVEDMTDGVYLCYFDADMGLPTALYGAVPTATPAPKYETNKPIVTPKPTAKPTPAPVTAAPAVTPTCEPAEDTEIYLETPTPTPTSKPEEDTVPVVTNTPVVTPGPGGGGEWGGSFATDPAPNQPETTYIPESGEGDNIDFGPTPTCEPNLPLDREDEEDCEPNLPLDCEESTEAPSTSREDVSGDEEVIGGDEDDEISGDDCEENVALPDRGDSGIVVVTPTPPCETNVPLDREESTEAPSTSREDVTFDEEVIGGDEEDCEPNEDTDIFLDP